MELYALKINGLNDPIGYCFDTVTVSWKVKNASGKKQRNARVEVSQQEDFSSLLVCREGAELSGLGVALNFPLSPCTRYFCRVTVTSDIGETAQAFCCFETAKLAQPWQGRWIGLPQTEDFHPEYRKGFALSGTVRQARLYICGLGLFEARLNGEKIGDDLLAPFINDYKEYFQYCTYDVTELLREENQLSVLLGRGWYQGKFGLSYQAHPERPFALIAELHLWYTDGRRKVIATDESWEVRSSFVTLSDIYDGETQDYQKEPALWEKAASVDAPGKLTERYSPPLHTMESLPVKELIRTPAGETVLDFGQNFAGYVECRQTIPAGAVMTLEFGEILQGGNFYHENYRTARSVFTYISDGRMRTIRPHFTFFGFRYVKVSGLADIDLSLFSGQAVYSEMEQTGHLATANKKINRLHENTLWGLKSNFVDMPMDCPQRDERLGWCGDAMVFSSTASWLMDTRAFYDKFCRDLRTDQKRNDGRVAIYLPNEFPGLTAAVWSDIATFLPQNLYTAYGDVDALRRHYPLMRDWVDSVRRQDQARGEKYLWDFGFQFGDWLALDGATPQSTFGRTDVHFVSSVYYYASAAYVAKAAEVLELPEKAAYEQLASHIRSAILEEYFTPTGRLAIDTQTAYLLALRFALCPDREKAIAAFQNRFKKDCRHLTGGFVGATMMNTVLADNGMADIAYDLLCYEGFPGWLYAVNLGATTIWERWNSVLPDGTVSGTGMNSLNHYSYGAVTEFLYRHCAGIQPMAPGFSSVRIAPKPDIRLGELSCTFDSASGQYESSWRINRDGSIYFRFEIPFGCEAEICLPEQEAIKQCAGVYEYTIHTKRDYRALYREDTPLERLLDDQRAVEILDRLLPGMVPATNRADAEAMSKSLADLRYKAALFHLPTDAYDRAISEIANIKEGADK